jgi:DNA-binding CsgD family transcriptional regulator
MIGGEIDLLPDDIEWRDQGCELFPSCLNCPLPRCVEDEPRGQQRLRMSARKKRMEELKRLGKSVREIAGLFRVSNRTVQRALQSLNGRRNAER